MRAVLVIVFVLLAVDLAACQFEEGDSCSFNNGETGICQFLPNCESVHHHLLSGKPLGRLCGFDGPQPIVCCPANVDIHSSTINPTSRSFSTRRTSPRTMTSEIPSLWAWSDDESKTDETESVSKKMCSVYAKSVYAMVDPPTLFGHRRPVNRSLCSISTQKLIVGGIKADPKEFPHMAAVGYDRNSDEKIFWLCGGTLVSDRFVMTAAHCTYSQIHGDATWVKVGVLSLKGLGDNSGLQEMKVTERIRHPNYQPPLQYHDIALLKLKSSVTFTAWVRPACLPNSLQIFRPEKVVATGWGNVDWGDDEGSDDLRKVTISIVPQKKCNSKFIGDSIDFKLNRGIVSEWQICAGEKGKDTCQGDSGGPLTVFNPDNFCMYTVIGVTSLGKICGSIVPGVYTRVQHYISWLEETIWREEYYDGEETNWSSFMRNRG